MLITLYATPLLSVSLRDVLAHLLGNGVAFVAGMLLFWSVLGVNWMPRVRSVPERAACVALLLVPLVAIGTMMIDSNAPFGAGWFAQANTFWSNPLSDQRWAGAVAVTFAAMLGCVLLMPLLVREKSPRR